MPNILEEDCNKSIKLEMLKDGDILACSNERTKNLKTKQQKTNSRDSNFTSQLQNLHKVKSESFSYQNQSNKHQISSSKQLKENCLNQSKLLDNLRQLKQKYRSNDLLQYDSESLISSQLKKEWRY